MADVNPLDGTVKKIKEIISASEEKTQKALNEQIENLEKDKKVLDKKFEDLTEKLNASNENYKTQQEAILEMKAKSGRQKTQDDRKISLKETIENAILENKDKFHAIANQAGGIIDPIVMKNISTSSLNANFVSYLNSTAGLEPTGQTRFRDMCRVIHSETDNVSFPVAADPVGTGSFGRQTEAANKAQVDRTYTMTSILLKPMAGYAIASRQSLRNITFLQQWLPTSMMEQLLDSEDTDFATLLAAAATGSTTTTYTVVAEKLIAYIRNNIKKKYNPTAICCDPDVWSDVLVTKPNDYSIPGVVSIDANGNTRILGRPMVPVNWLTGRRVLLGDWSKVAIVQSEGLVMRQTDSHASTFTSNETTFLLERTENLAIFRPNAFITTTV